MITQEWYHAPHANSDNAEKRLKGGPVRKPDGRIESNARCPPNGKHGWKAASRLATLIERLQSRH